MQDDTGTIQFYIDKSRMGESFQSLKDWTDAGDIIGNHLFYSSPFLKFVLFYMLSVPGTCIGVRGTIKRTEKGELSIYAKVTFFKIKFPFTVH